MIPFQLSQKDEQLLQRLENISNSFFDNIVNCSVISINIDDCDQLILLWYLTQDNKEDYLEYIEYIMLKKNMYKTTRFDYSLLTEYLKEIRNNSIKYLL